MTKTDGQSLCSGVSRRVSLCPHPAAVPDVPLSIESVKYSKNPSLLSIALLLFRARGRKVALPELYGCYRRILLILQKGWDISGLEYEAVRRSLPQVEFVSCPTEIHACSKSIRTLEKDRPFLGIGDVELFEQGWFQAIEYRNHISGNESRTDQPSFNSTT